MVRIKSVHPINFFTFTSRCMNHPPCQKIPLRTAQKGRQRLTMRVKGTLGQQHCLCTHIFHLCGTALSSVVPSPPWDSHIQVCPELLKTRHANNRL